MTGHATTTEDQAGNTSWGDSPKAAFAVRALVFMVPLAIAFAATWMLSQRWEAPTSIIGALGRFVALAVVAMVVATAADRVARRFLPLAALLRLSLVFPDQAPSRFAVALRSNNTKKLEKRLAALDAGAHGGDEAEAARIIVELAASLSRHDRLTRGHSERVRAYTGLIAEEMALSPEDSNRLQWAGLIHDVGKLRIPYEILTKPGKLTDREYEIIKTHPAEGMRIAAPLAGFLGEWIHAVGQHHERFDGGGYPNGLVGNQISLGGRIVAVADTYDVITAARSYKKPESAAWAREEIARCAGTQFDPDVVRAFLNVGLGEVRRSMWPLSWALQIPFLGSAVTAPIAQTVAASVVTLATATGVAAAGGGFAPITNAPEAIAFVETSPAGGGSDTTSTTAAGRVLPDGSGDGFDLTPRSQVGDSAATSTSVGPTTTADPPSTTTSTVADSTSTTSTSATSTSTTTTPNTSTTETTTTISQPTTTTTVLITTTTIPIAPLDDCERAQNGDVDLTWADLSGCEIGAVSLAGADLTNANLAGAVFVETGLQGADFRHADLTNATFDHVEAQGAYFKYLDMAGAEITSSDMSDAWFYESNLAGVTITDSTMARAILQRSDLTNAKLDDVNLTEADAREALFGHATIDRSNFAHADLRYSSFTHAVVRDTSFLAARLDGVSFINSSIIRTDMSQTTAGSDPVDFTDAQFDDGTMYDAEYAQPVFAGATVIAWSFDKSWMPHADFTESTIVSATTAHAGFPESEWQGAHIDGLDMADGSFQGADFTGAVGHPLHHELADLDNAVCPGGLPIVGSVICWD